MNTTNATTNADTRNPYALAHRFGSIFLVATAELDLLDDQDTTEELATQVALERFEDAGLALAELYAINHNQAEAIAVALVAEGIRSAGCTRSGIAQAIALEAVGYVADHGREFVELEEAAAAASSSSSRKRRPATTPSSWRRPRPTGSPAASPAASRMPPASARHATPGAPELGAQAPASSSWRRPGDRSPRPATIRPRQELERTRAPWRPLAGDRCGVGS